MKGNRMRKVLLVLVGLIGLLGLFAPAANASGPSHSTPTVCHTKSGVEFGEDAEYHVKICSNFIWSLQNDGTGVHLDGMNIWVDYGCNELETHPVTDLYINIEAGSSSNGQTVGDMNDCTAFRTLDLRGNDNGGSQAFVSFNVAVDTASDYRASHTCDIHPNNPDDCWSWHN